jgi:peptide/nickel transport system permease protein
MAATTVTGGDAAPPVRARGGLRRMWGPISQAKGMQRWMLLVGVALTIAFVFTALFGKALAPYSFDTYKDAAGEFPHQAHPSARNHWGTTVQGLDVMSRTILGARTALEVMLLAVIVSLSIGVPLGIVSGYVGGPLDRLMVLVADAMFAFPPLLLAIVAAFVLAGSFGSGIVVAAIAITVVYIPQYFRVVRASTLSAREATYIEAARAMGAKPHTIVRKYLLANVIQSVPVVATLNAADAILTLAGLGFLGYGIQPDEAAEWGYDLQRAIADAGAGIWWTALYPGLAIVLAVLSLTLVGEGLNDVLNPTLRRRRFKPPAIRASSRGPASTVLEEGP